MFRDETEIKNYIHNALGPFIEARLNKLLEKEIENRIRAEVRKQLTDRFELLSRIVENNNDNT